jgi:hypothetical protein
MERDADGELPPTEVLTNRYEAWAWDEEKKMRLGNRQKAAPTYTPNWIEFIVDPFCRRFYFKGDPAEVVRGRYLKKKRIMELSEKAKWFNAEKLREEQDAKYSKSFSDEADEAAAE